MRKFAGLACQRLLNGDERIRLLDVVFDLLGLDGRSTMYQPYVQRRRLLEALRLAGRHWQTSPALSAIGCDDCPRRAS